MRLLAVAPYVPYEGVDHAGGMYVLRHLQALSRDHDVTLLVPESDGMRHLLPRVPDWLDVEVAPLRLDTRRTTTWVADAAYRRAMGVPPGPTRESLRALRRAGLVERAREADLVELHWPEYARFAAELQRAGVRTPVSVVEHDVDVEANAARLREYASGYRKVLGLATAPLARRDEVAGLRAADLVLVFKAEDEQLLRRLGIPTETRVIDPWVDDPGPQQGQRRTGEVLFAGAMWRRENADGARWLLDRVWPAVRAAVPGARLVLAGARPRPELEEAVDSAGGAAGGVELTGTVDDLLPYYSRASLFVAPMFMGGGLKFKVAQAMRCGLPVVLTENSGQGVVGAAPGDALWAVTDDPARMADEIVRGLRDPAALASTGARAAAWAERQWSFDRSVSAVEQRYRQLVAARRDGQ